MGSAPSARRPRGPAAPRHFAGTLWVPALAARCKHGPGPGPAPAPVRLPRSKCAGQTAPFGGHPSPVRGPPGLLARLPSRLWCAAGPPSPPRGGVVAVGPCSATPRSAIRPVASSLGPVPGSLVGPGRPSASPAGVPPGSSARPPAASYLRPRGSALASPLRLARRRLRCGLPLVALPALRRAFRRRVRPPGPPLRRPLRAVLAAVLVGVGSVGLLRPGALAGPRPPLGGAGAPSVWRSAPGLLRCGAGAPAGAACCSSGCCRSGVSPLPPPRSPSPAGGGGGHRAQRVASPPKGSAFRGPLWAPPAPSGRCPAGAAPRR